MACAILFKSPFEEKSCIFPNTRSLARSKDRENHRYRNRGFSLRRREGPGRGEPPGEPRLRSLAKGRLSRSGPTELAELRPTVLFAFPQTLRAVSLEGSAA